ncbi:MAG: undecaprenyl-diphosphate phosphatase [Clostridia bacterium]|nr:undecaprenyl-diphosphate phosphatase [Clostridia bacterium]
MEIWQAAILGLVQGLTEFLPVSSSGHIAFFDAIFNTQTDVVFFTLILHLGTLVAVCAVFWRDILALFKKPFKTLGLLVLATIPAAIVGVVIEACGLDDILLARECVGIVLSVLFLVTAVLLFVTEFVAKRRENVLPLCLKTAMPMGVAQAFAVLPGISRSGSTICAGTLAGCNSEDVAKFSFLMSIPVILGGFFVELALGLYKGEIQQNFAEYGGALGWSVAIGFIISAVAGLFAIKVMLKIIKKANYKWFSLYLVLMSITSLVLHFTVFNA